MSIYNGIYISQYVKRNFHSYHLDGNARILDLGCGSRPYLKYYKSRFGQCVSTDYRVKTGVDVCSDALSLPFNSGVFDFVLMTEVIEHLPDAAAALHEVRRVLKPSGCLLLTWPFIHPLHEIPHDHLRITEFGISQLASRCGLEVVSLSRRGNAFVVLSALFEFFVLGVLTALSRIPLIGRVFWLIHWGAERVVYWVYNVWIWATCEGIRSSDKSSEGLHGFVGHLRIWNLGYCACLRPIRKG